MINLYYDKDVKKYKFITDGLICCDRQKIRENKKLCLHENDKNIQCKNKQLINEYCKLHQIHFWKKDTTKKYVQSMSEVVEIF